MKADKKPSKSSVKKKIIDVLVKSSGRPDPKPVRRVYR